MKDKLFVVRKYVRAKNVADALKKERTASVDDVWWDDDDKKSYSQKQSDIGFKA